MGIAKALYVGTTLNVAGASTLAAITGTFNGTVGATTPSTGAFTTLSATSTTTHQGVFSGWDSVGGANSQNGSITIGSASADQGVIHYRGNGGSTALYIDNTYDVAAAAVTIRTRTSGTPVEVGTFTSTGLAVTGTLSATGAITSTLATGQWLGNVSGNTTTLYSLVNNSGGYLIQGVSSSTGGAWASGLNSNYASFLGTLGATDLIFGTQNVGRMNLDSSGNLGLGVTPSATTGSGVKGFEIGGVGDGLLGNGGASAGNVWVTCNTYFSSGFKKGAAGYASVYNQSGGVHTWSTSNAAGGAAGNAITFVDTMTLNASGNLLVGTTTNPNGVFLRTKGTNGDQFEMDNDGSRFTSFYLSNNGTNKVSSYWDNTLAKYQIVPVTNGVYLASGGTSWTAVSDERVKDIIEPIENATDKLSGLRAIVGKYKTDEEGIRRSFLIAQDVQAVFPEAVDSTNQNELGLRYQDLIPVLVKAIQELSAKVTALENK